MARTQPSGNRPAVAYAAPVRFRARLGRLAVVCTAAFAAVAAAVYFLIDSQRAAGAVTIAVVVALAGYLALGMGSGSRGSLRPIIVGTAAATAIAIAAFALAILLLAVTGRG